MGERDHYQHYAISDARERIAQLGISSLSATELLTLVLGTQRTQDPLRVSEQLIATYGGVGGIAQAHLTELESVKGMGPAKAAQLKSAIELGYRVTIYPPDKKALIKTPAEAGQMLIPRMGHLEQEELHSISLDSRNRIISEGMIYRGTLNSINVRMGDIFRSAIRDNAASIIIAHNHPSKDPSPSAEDVSMTREVVKAGKLLQVETLDHLIIAGTLYTSLKEQGLGFDTW